MSSITTILDDIKKDISSLTNNRSKLFLSFIKERLQKSFQQYKQEVEADIKYLLYRRNDKVLKYIRKKESDLNI